MAQVMPGYDNNSPMSRRTAWAVGNAIEGRTHGPVLLSQSGTRLDR